MRSEGRQLRRFHRTALIAAVLGVSAALLPVGSALADPTGSGAAPRTAADPGTAASDGAAAPDGTAAADTADAVAARIVQLSAELTAPQETLAAAQALAALALDDYQAKQADLAAAQAAAQQATDTAAHAADELAASRTAFLTFARRSYMAGGTSPGAAAFLTAEPADYVQRAVYLYRAGAYRSDELARLVRAQQDAEHAQAAARQALDAATRLSAQAEAALLTAQNAQREARRQAALVGQQPELQAQLEAARRELVGLVGEQDAARRTARAQSAAATASAAVAAAGPVANPRTAGQGKAAVVLAAVTAARRYLGTPYAWGGGGTAGPSHGIDLDAAVIGFDCSALTQYAYAQAGVVIPRNSRAQFSQLPKVGRGQLQAGDLVFWATDPGNWRTIHHVAIYLGDGSVVQAPASGDVVKISPMSWAGYAGAVRPTA